MEDNYYNSKFNRRQYESDKAFSERRGIRSSEPGQCLCSGVFCDCNRSGDNRYPKGDY